jgi:hypothetical protein
MTCGAKVISPPFDKIWACSFATFAAATIAKYKHNKASSYHTYI